MKKVILTLGMLTLLTSCDAGFKFHPYGKALNFHSTKSQGKAYNSSKNLALNPHTFASEIDGWSYEDMVDFIEEGQYIQE